MNFTKEQAETIYRQAQENGLDADAVMAKMVSRGAVFEGVDMNHAKQYASQYDAPTPEKEKKDLLGFIGKDAEKVADFTGGKELAQVGAVALNRKFIGKKIDEVQKVQGDTMDRLIDRIKEKEARGEDTTKLKEALKELGVESQKFGDSADELLNPNDLTPEQVVGDALQLAGTAAAGKVAGSIASKATGATGLVKGAIQGAGTGVATGAVTGAVEGTAQGLQQDKDIDGVVGDAVKGAGAGAVIGGVLGGLTGAVSGGIKGRKLNQAVIKAQEDSGLRPTLNQVVQEKSKVDPKFGELVKEAKKQGLNDSEINFLSTVEDPLKPTLREMYTVTTKAQSDPRQTVRAADILGKNATEIVKQVQTQNSTAGKAVDTTAKALRGKFVDASPVRDRTLGLLEDAGVTLNDNGSLNWKDSVFNKTPQLQKKLVSTLSDLPAGQTDAYKLHNFKKSIDEVVDYGVNGEGLKGKSANILKAIRNEADTILDSQFDDYNRANTEFKVTRDFIDSVKKVVGKDVDFATPQAEQAFGQSFRSAFSNNKSRPQTLKLIEDLQTIAKERGLKGAENSLLDQALYVNMLEDHFGSQAATGVASEVAKGVKKVKGLVGVLRNPITGTANLVADKIENMQNISPELKKQMLLTFIQ